MIITTLPFIWIEEDFHGRNHKAQANCYLCEWESSTGTPPNVEIEAADHLEERHPRRYHTANFRSYEEHKAKMAVVARWDTTPATGKRRVD